MSQTVSENAKFNVANKTQTSEENAIKIDDYVNLSVPGIGGEIDVYKAAKLLTDRKISGVAVVDSENCLIGFLSEKDILKHVYDSKYNSLPPGQVEHYMSKNVTTIESGTDLFQVVHLFINYPYHGYPFVKDGKYKGMIFRDDVLSAVCKLKDKVF